MDKEKSFTVHDLPKPERLRERLKRFGPEALSAQELLIVDNIPIMYYYYNK